MPPPRQFVGQARPSLVAWITRRSRVLTMSPPCDGPTALMVATPTIPAPWPAGGEFQLVPVGVRAPRGSWSGSVERDASARCTSTTGCSSGPAASTSRPRRSSGTAPPRPTRPCATPLRSCARSHRPERRSCGPDRACGTVAARGLAPRSSFLGPTPARGRGSPESAPLDMVPHNRKHRDFDTLTRTRLRRAPAPKGPARPARDARSRLPSRPTSTGSRPVHHVRRR